MVTVITRTIGPSGRDYASFTLAEADVTNIGTSGDLVANDEAIVFEADAGDYSGNFQFYTAGALTCDATRNVTWTHAAGAEHGGQFESGANIIGYCLMQEAYAVVDGLSVSPTSGDAFSVANGVAGVIGQNLCCLSSSECVVVGLGGTAAEPVIVRNCTCKSTAGRGMDLRSEGTGDSHLLIVNNTVFSQSSQGFLIGQSSSDTLSIEMYNNLVIAPRAWFALAGSYTLAVSGSNNFGGSSLPLPSAIQGSPYPITATTNTDPGTGDFAIYDATTLALVDDPDNDVLNQGAGPLINSNVPKTDIVGAARDNFYADPGAFQVSSVIPQLATTQAFGAAVSHQRTVTRQSATVSVAATAQVRS